MFLPMFLLVEQLWQVLDKALKDAEVAGVGVDLLERPDSMAQHAKWA